MEWCSRTPPEMLPAVVFLCDVVIFSGGRRLYKVISYVYEIKGDIETSLVFFFIRGFQWKTGQHRRAGGK